MYPISADTKIERLLTEELSSKAATQINSKIIVNNTNALVKKN